MHAGRRSPTPTPTPTPTSTPLTCACPTAPSTTPPAAPTITFTSTDSCTPEGGQAQAPDSVMAAVYFTAEVQFEEPLQSTLTAADFGVGSVAPPPSLAGSSNSSSANCSCGTAARREAAPGMVFLPPLHTLIVNTHVTADGYCICNR